MACISQNGAYPLHVSSQLSSMSQIISHNGRLLEDCAGNWVATVFLPRMNSLLNSILDAVLEASVMRSLLSSTLKVCESSRPQEQPKQSKTQPTLASRLSN